MPFLLLFFNISVTFNIQLQTFKPVFLLYSAKCHQAPFSLVYKWEKNLSLSTPPQFSKATELMPGCSQIITLPQPCSLLPGSQ